MVPVGWGVGVAAVGVVTDPAYWTVWLLLSIAIVVAVRVNATATSAIVAITIDF